MIFNTPLNWTVMMIETGPCTKRSLYSYNAPSAQRQKGTVCQVQKPSHDCQQQDWKLREEENASKASAGSQS